MITFIRVYKKRKSYFMDPRRVTKIAAALGDEYDSIM
jgi:hypothetical protein